MSFDFIIIGSGLAGLTSALVAKDYGRVLVITKGKISDSATNLAQGGIAAVVEKDCDSFGSHIKDTMEAGANHNDRKAVEYLVKTATRAIKWLESQGVCFEKRNSHFAPTREAAHSFPRVLHSSDFTGRAIETALIKRVKQAKNIEIWENSFVSDLLVKDKACVGIQIIHRHSGFDPESIWIPHPVRDDSVQLVQHDMYNNTISIFSHKIILATGGIGKVYQWTTNPMVATGDGVALAYRAGAKVKDMEFIQFHPTALKNSQSPLFLLSEALRGEGAYLVKRNALKHSKNLKPQSASFVNPPISGLLQIFSVKESINPCMARMQKEERFMGDYDKRLELAPRDIVARAIFAEQKKGYEVYLDIRHKGKEFLQKRFPNIYKELKKRGLDLKKRGLDLSADLIPVTPAAHYSCGGVETDLYGRTSIKNLFAFGEVSCTGVHGANRLASNSLLEAVVFPLRLKELMLGHSGKSRPGRDASRIPISLLNLDKRYDSGFADAHQNDMKNIIKRLQTLMWEKAGIVRTEKGLKEALKQIEILICHPGLISGFTGKIDRKIPSGRHLGWWQVSPPAGGRSMTPPRWGNQIELLETKNMLLVSKLIIQSALKRKKSLGSHWIDG